MMSALLAVWTAFSFGPAAAAEETIPGPPAFQKVLVLFSADTAKGDRDEFLAGLEEVRLRHMQAYSETVRQQREAASAGSDARRTPVLDPHFLDVVDIQTIRTGRENPFFDESQVESRLWDLEPLPALVRGSDPAEALIVVASDAISADLTRMIRTGLMGSGANETVVLFAGVSSFDESIRTPHGAEPAKARYAFAVKHPDDPWPNTELALMAFPKTRRIVLLTPAAGWDAAREAKYREKLGPGRTLKTVLLPEVPDGDMTEEDIEALKQQFAAAVTAEIQPDTVIVTRSSVESGWDPVSWLPADFKACPIFADTKPARPASVGGFCRSMRILGEQAADLLEHLSEDSLSKNRLPEVIQENDELWLNSHAVRKYGLKTSGFPENALLMSTSSAGREPVRLGRSLTRKRIVILLFVNLFVLFWCVAYVLTAMRRGGVKRQLIESVYRALPVRVMVMDRDGRILDYHGQPGEVEQVPDPSWRNVDDVPWLRGTDLKSVVHEVFDSGKTVIRELVVDGERRTMVLSRTETDVFGRPAVVAVDSAVAGRDAQA